MKRREFGEKFGISSAAAVLAAGATRANAPGTVTVTPRGRQEHDHRPVKGSPATATVSFGEWRTEVPLDRSAPQAPIPPPPSGNGHLVLPHQGTTKVGGTVNYIIARFHEVVV